MNFIRFSHFSRNSRFWARGLASQWLEVESIEVKMKGLLEFYENFFELDSRKTNDLIKKNPLLYNSALNIKDLEASGQFLKQNDFLTMEILKSPNCLLIDHSVLSRRLKVLDECSVQRHKLFCLYEFNKIMLKKVKVLKLHNIIPNNVQVSDEILKILDIRMKLPTTNDEKSLHNLRGIILKLYLKAKLNLLRNYKMYKTGPLEHQSFASIVKIIDILQNRLNFNEEQICKNNILLHACPDNISKLLTEVPTINDVSMKEIILDHPEIAFFPADSIKTSIYHIKSFDIPEDRILNFIDILSLPSDTIKERLMLIPKEKKLNIFWSHPKVLKLIFNQETAMKRLAYIDKMKMKSASLNILSGSSDSFERYSRRGFDKRTGTGYDIALFLSSLFNRHVDEIKEGLQRHPHWYLIPITSVKATVEYLRYMKFKDEEILENIYILLYPVSRIQQKLTPLMEAKKEEHGNQTICEVPLQKISNSTLLNLCLYYIEADFHFSCDGVWDEELTAENELEAFPPTLVVNSKKIEEN